MNKTRIMMIQSLIGSEDKHNQFLNIHEVSGYGNNEWNTSHDDTVSDWFRKQT